MGTSAVEVTHVSEHGFWVLLPRGEILVPFDRFPWFRDATIRQLQKVKLLHADHLYWPELDVDLSIDSIEHPERYPLVSKAESGKGSRPSRAGRVAERTSSGRRSRGR